MASLGKKIVFVVGAGASREVDIPTGKELTKNIADALYFQDAHGDDTLRQCIGLQQRSDPKDKQSYRLACRRIVVGMPQAESIDSFIHENRQDERIEFCGKLAITKCILNAEKESKLYNRLDAGRRFNFGDIGGTGATWYDRFFSLLKRGRQAHELQDRLDSVSIIVFNYDRCIEHYLFHALKNYYDLDDQKSANLVGQIKIYHPYGSVGKLPWQNKSQAVEYGEDLYLSHLMESANLIRTFTEGAADKDITEVRQDIIAAETVVFLGFAFHDINMELLRPTEFDRGIAPASELRKRYFATAKGVHKFEQQICLTAMNSLTSAGVHGTPIIEDMDCVHLFDRYGRGFSLD